MFFAVNPWSEATLVQLSAAVEAAQATDRSCHAFALLDLAFEPGWLEEPRWRRTMPCPMYAQGRLAELSSLGLWLLPLRHVAPTTPEALAALQRRVNGKPMFSVLLSAWTPEDLSAYWQPFYLARTPDGLEWPVRWGDTRVLPHLMAALTPAEHAHVMAPLQAWLGVNRSGEVMRWDGPGLTDARSWPDQVWALDDVRFGQLVDACEADAVISRIDDQRPDLLKLNTPWECHHMVAQCLSLADHGGLLAAPDRQALSMIGMSLDAEFLKHPAFLRLLDNTRAGSGFAQEIKALPDEFWNDCARQSAVF